MHLSFQIFYTTLVQRRTFVPDPTTVLALVLISKLNFHAISRQIVAVNFKMIEADIEKMVTDNSFSLIGSISILELCLKRQETAVASMLSDFSQSGQLWFAHNLSLASFVTNLISKRVSTRKCNSTI